MNTLSQDKKNAEIIGVSSSHNTIKSCCKDGHAPALQLLKGCERTSESRDLHPTSSEKPLDFRTVNIIGVFSKAVYLESDGEVFVIHDKRWGYVPFGIAQDNIESFIKDGGFEVGKSIEIPVPVREKSLLCGLTLPSANRISEVEKIIAEKGEVGGIIELYNTRNTVKAHIDGLFSSLCKNSGDAAEYAVKLIGLGRGLTPSGDDFLSGMFALFFAAEKCDIPILQEVSRCAAAVNANLSRTSKISGAYLASVLRRERFTLYENAVLALLGDSAAQAFADKVLPLGASSGTDTLCGALLAAKVLCRL